MSALYGQSFEDTGQGAKTLKVLGELAFVVPKDNVDAEWTALQSFVDTLGDWVSQSEKTYADRGWGRVHTQVCFWEARQYEELCNAFGRHLLKILDLPGRAQRALAWVFPSEQLMEKEDEICPGIVFIRLLHSLDRSLIEQLAEFSVELGGAERVTLAAPFHDGVGLDTLCARLELDHVFVHSHGGGTVGGTFGSNWPTGMKATVLPVAMASFAADSRRLHAKAFEIVCRRGRIVLSGSANATLAALDHGRNVEVCVARIQRGPVISWRVTPCSPLMSSAASGGEDKEGTSEGVLRATLEGDQLKGSIVTPFPVGSAIVARVTASGLIPVGETIVLPGGEFTLAGRDIEREAWTAHRLILRVTSADSAAASGFVSFGDFVEIKRHLGSVASRLFAVLAGGETPDDVAAVMSWFHEHPEYLSAPAGGAGGGRKKDVRGEVALSGLLDPNAVTFTGGSGGEDSGAPKWRRFIDLILACFREPRGPINSDDESEESVADNGAERGKNSRSTRTPPSSARPLNFLDRLFDGMLKGPAERRSNAFWFAHYVCDRLDPDPVRVKSYLDKLIAAFRNEPPLAADCEAATAAVLVWATDLVLGDDMLVVPRAARRRLLRMGADVDGAMPDLKLVQGFVRALAADYDFGDLWEKIRAVRTPQEEVRAFRLAGPRASLGPEFPYLAGLQEFTEITPRERKSLIFMTRFDSSCPKCHLSLPVGQSSRLREVGVARAYCCGRTLLCEEI